MLLSRNSVNPFCSFLDAAIAPFTLPKYTQARAQKLHRCAYGIAVAAAAMMVQQSDNILL